VAAEPAWWLRSGAGAGATASEGEGAVVEVAAGGFVGMSPPVAAEGGVGFVVGRTPATSEGLGVYTEEV